MTRSTGFQPEIARRTGFQPVYLRDTTSHPTTASGLASARCGDSMGPTGEQASNVRREDTVPELSETTRALLRLTLTPGLGPRRIAALTEAFGNPIAALAANPAELERVRGIGRATAGRVARGLRESQDLASREIELAEREGVRIVGRTDPEYPPLLAQIPDPPPVLYVLGQLRPDDDDRYPVGIVGSRSCTAYGIEQAERFAGVLGAAGLTVTSGGARGIDSAAHRGAIKAGGRTVAVLGCGLCHRYPPDNARLFEQIADGRGALVSELPMSVPPSAENFPGRNRIISGLSLGVVVIEAARGSGALITAEAAAVEHGREVFALPGRVDSPASEGSLALLRAGGAAIAIGPGDVLEALETPARHLYHDTHEARYADPTAKPPSNLWSDGDPEARPGAPADPMHARVLEALAEPSTPDTLIETLGLDPAQVRTALTMLEIRGLIRRRGSLLERVGRV
jgi:DNA processing protein